MKKTYLTPAFTIVAIATHHIIMSSTTWPTLKYTGTNEKDPDEDCVAD